MPKHAVLLFLVGMIIALSFLPLNNASAQTGTDNIWLNSPTQPRVVCGAPWGGYNPYGNQAFHNAIDFCGGYEGGDVVAVADCQVVYVGWFPTTSEASGAGHGKIAACWHKRNGVYTYYAHLQKVLVEPGQEVKRGEVIGLEGHTGFASGPHVHFSVAVKDPVTMEAEPCWYAACWPNPDDYLGKDNTFSGSIPPTDPSVSHFFELTFEEIPVEEETSYIVENRTQMTAPTDDLKTVLLYALYFMVAVFILCFVFSKSFRRGTLTLIIFLLPLLLILYLVLGPA